MLQNKRPAGGELGGNPRPKRRRADGPARHLSREITYYNGVRKSLYSTTLVVGGGKTPREVLLRDPVQPTAYGNYWIERLAGFAKAVGREVSAEEEEDYLGDPLRRHCEQMARRLDTRQLSEGDKRLRRFYHYIDSFGVAPTQQQRVIIWAAIQSVLPQIYGAEWETSAPRVTRMFGIKKVNPFTLTIAMRRMGKTWALAMIIAAYMLSMKGKKVAVFAAVARSAQWVIDKALVFMQAVKGEDVNRRICGKSRMSLSIALEKMPESVRSAQSDRAGQIRSMRTTNHVTAFPCSETGVRGFDANLVVLEEAAFMKKQVFTRGIVPVLGINDSALLGISTPDSDNIGRSFFMRAIEQRLNGEFLYMVTRVSLACQECVDDGRAAQCPHRVSMAPPWKGAGRAEILKAMTNDEFAYKQETLGLTNASRDTVWVTRYIHNLRRRERSSARRHKIVYFGIDPAGGGAGSDYTIVSLVRSREGMIVSSWWSAGAGEVDGVRVDTGTRHAGHSQGEDGVLHPGRARGVARNGEDQSGDHPPEAVLVLRVQELGVSDVPLVLGPDQLDGGGGVVVDDQQDQHPDLVCVVRCRHVFLKERPVRAGNIGRRAGGRGHSGVPRAEGVHIARPEELTQIATDHWRRLRINWPAGGATENGPPAHARNSPRPAVQQLCVCAAG